MVRPAISKGRKAPKRKAKTKKPQPEHKGLYFDRLSDCTVERILRLFAPASRRNLDWNNHIPVETVLIWAQCGGSFRRVVQNAFREVRFTVGNRRDSIEQGLEVYGRHEQVSHLMQAVPVALGATAHTLDIYGSHACFSRLDIQQSSTNPTPAELRPNPYRTQPYHSLQIHRRPPCCTCASLCCSTR